MRDRIDLLDFRFIAVGFLPREMLGQSSFNVNRIDYRRETVLPFAWCSCFKCGKLVNRTELYQVT